MTNAPFRTPGRRIEEPPAIRHENRRGFARWVALSIALVFVVIGMADCSDGQSPLAAKARVGLTIVGLVVAMAAALWQAADR